MRDAYKRGYRYCAKCCEYYLPEELINGVKCPIHQCITRASRKAHRNIGKKYIDAEKILGGEAP